MSRIYLILLCGVLPMLSFGQTELKKILRVAEEKQAKGDFFYAKELYEQALRYDSASVSILWNYAETLRSYQDYPKAAFYYGKVFAKEDARIYPMSLIYWGMMLKQCGEYDQALEVFKLAKKKYAKDKKSFAYLKARQEVSACVWAKSNQFDSTKVIFSALPQTVNTKNAEFGHLIVDNKLVFSSLRADSVHAGEEVYDKNYHTHLYQSTIQDGKFGQAEVLKELYWEKLNTGNGALSLDGKRFYFSLCGEGGASYRCKLMVAQFVDGRWSKPDSLGSVINELGYTTTQPTIAQIDGEEWLVFSSDRSEGKGGMDLWYSVVKNGNQYSKPKPLKSLNTIGNEVTPSFDRSTQTLYFSSDFHEGFGGFDVFSATYNNANWSEPVNLGVPANSPANDLYFFAYGDSAFVSSNRIGSLFSKNPTCCADVFMFYREPEPEVVEPEETLEELNARLPVTLYFHNDIPDPRSWATTTDVNYIDSYNDYTKMLGNYQKEYAKGLSGDKARDAEENIEDFFIEYVDKGVKDLALFRDLLLKELQKGARINVRVKGFASPLAKTDYNVNLTKRRIASLVNYLRAFNGGVFAPYIDHTASNGGQLVFTEIPFGEYRADQLISDNPNDKKNSVYSRAAAMERKIEIQSVTFIETDDSLAFALKPAKHILGAGVRKQEETIEMQFVLYNQLRQPITITAIEVPCACVDIVPFDKTIPPLGELKLNVVFHTRQFEGHTVKSILLRTDLGQELELMISTEVK